MKRIALLIILVLTVMPWSEAMAARKALVIGIGTYEHFNDLSTTEEDARVFAETLQRFGFEVQQPGGSDIRSLKAARETFLRSLSSADEALFFFSGHGMQRDGDNFLFAADSNVDEASSISAVHDHAINVTHLVQEMERRAALALLFLDACRTIQLPGNKGEIKGVFTFGNVELQQHASFIGFAAQENRPASTGDGALSPYTEALVVALSNDALASEPLPQLYSHVRRQVREATQGSQIPDYRNQLGNREFRFAEHAQPTVTPPPNPDPTERKVIEPPDPVDKLLASLKAVNKTMIVTRSVSLRRSPTLTAGLSGDVEEGRVVQVLAQTEGWYQIRIGQDVGYLQTDYLYEWEPIELSKTMIVTRSVSIRRSPTSSASAGDVKEGQEVQVLARSGGWYQVRIGHKLAYLETGHLYEWAAEKLSKTMVATRQVPVRRSPTSTASLAGAVKKGQKIGVLAQAEGWYQVRVGQDVVYVPTETLRDLQCRTVYETRIVRKTKRLYEDAWAESWTRSRCRSKARYEGKEILQDDCDDLDDDYDGDLSSVYTTMLEWDSYGGRFIGDCEVEVKATCSYREESKQPVDEICE